MKFEKRVTIYSFVLTVFVIWLHAGESLVSSIPGQIAVPGFFIMSGYLFFRNIDVQKDPVSVTAEKIRRRGKTLLLPYLLWNAIYFVIYLLAGKAEISEAFGAVFLYRCNPVFWYLYQLILVTLLTPALFFVLRKKETGILFLSVIFLLATVCGKLPFHYCNEDALFYYSFGAFAAVFGKETAEKTEGSGKTAAVFFMIFLFFTAAERFVPVSVRNAGTVGWRAAGAAGLWFLFAALLKEEMTLPKPWMEHGFFIYATHYMVIRAVWGLLSVLCPDTSAAVNIAVYLAMPAVCTLAAAVLTHLMKKVAPGFLSVLTGGR